MHMFDFLNFSKQFERGLAKTGILGRVFTPSLNFRPIFFFHFKNPKKQALFAKFLFSAQKFYEPK